MKSSNGLSPEQNARRMQEYRAKVSYKAARRRELVYSMFNHIQLLIHAGERARAERWLNHLSRLTNVPRESRRTVSV